VAQSLYVAMFDEIDEGTAIYKVSNENNVPLNGDSGLKFIGVEADLPTDYYLWLIGQGASWFHGVGKLRGPQNLHVSKSCLDFFFKNIALRGF